MPLYHFHIHHGAVHRDLCGEELRDQEHAWEEATRIAGDAIKDIDGKLKPGRDWVLEVTDEFQGPLWEIKVSASKK
jgi:hypothetical protein